MFWLRVRLTANLIRQWLTENIGSVPPWLDSHINAIAAFFMIEQKDNPMTFVAVWTALQPYLAIVGTYLNPLEAAKVGETAYEALPTGSTPRQAASAILKALIANGATVFPNAIFEPVIVWLLGVAADRLAVAPATMAGYHMLAADPFDDLYEKACAA